MRSVGRHGAVPAVFVVVKHPCTHVLVNPRFLVTIHVRAPLPQAIERHFELNPQRDPVNGAELSNKVFADDTHMRGRVQHYIDEQRVPLPSTPGLTTAPG